MRIKTIAEHEADGAVKIEYERLIENFGMVPNVTKVFSIHPEIFQLHNEMYRKIMVEPSHLPKPVKQIIAILVAVSASCDYCRFWHSRFLAHLGVDEELIDLFGRDFRQAAVDEKTMTLLEYADCVARNSTAVTDENVNRLRENGFSDEEILEATTLVGYMSFLTRVVNAMGVEIEPLQNDRAEDS
jgi:uncharacterized peroxidase-related enzyme